MTEEHRSLKQIIDFRLEKLEKLKENGIDPYPYSFNKTHISESIKKFMFVNTKAPYGTVYALESLEVVLISAAFDQDVSLVFCDDGVFQISNNQNTEASGIKNFSNAYKALGDYDINKLYV